ncbi:MAG TPA: OB-fold domain-containing protein [Geomonas sp.]
MSRVGTVFTYSVVYSGTEFFKEKTPYVVAIVEENKRKAMARIEGYTEKTVMKVGMEVEFLTEDGDGNSIYRFI